MSRMDQMTSFLVMDIVKKSKHYENVVHFEIGEPDIPPAPGVVEALEKAARDGRFGYTESTGILPLREKIAEFYQKMYGVEISPERVVVTVGTSGAFLIAYSILLEAGDRVGLADPSYPCYKNFAYLLNVIPEFFPVDSGSSYQITPGMLNLHAGNSSTPCSFAFESGRKHVWTGCIGIAH